MSRRDGFSSAVRGRNPHRRAGTARALLLCGGAAVVVLWALVGPASARNPVTSDADLQRAAALDSLKTRYGITRLAWGKYGVPKTIEGRLSEPLQGRAPEEAFFEFMEQNRRWMKFTNPRADFEVVEPPKTYPQSGRMGLTVEQHYQGIPIYNSRVHIVFDRDGVMDRISGNMYPGIDLPTTQALSVGEAISIARDNAVVPGYGHLGDIPHLIVYPTDSAYYLCLSITLGFEYFVRYRHFVDVIEGTHVGRFPLYIREFPLPEDTELWDPAVPPPTAEDDQAAIRRMREERQNPERKGPISIDVEPPEQDLSGRVRIIGGSVQTVKGADSSGEATKDSGTSDPQPEAAAGGSSASDRPDWPSTVSTGTPQFYCG
jgi:hypothetical protein